MAFLFGMLIGDTLKRVGFFCAFGTMLLLGGISFASYRLVERNLDPAMATAAAVVVPAVLLVWAIWRPLRGLRLWIVDGVYLAARFGMLIGLVGFAAILPGSGFHVGLWLARAWTWAALAAVLWVVQRLLQAQVRRVHRIAEAANDREMLA